MTGENTIKFHKGDLGTFLNISLDDLGMNHKEWQKKLSLMDDYEFL